MWKKNIKHKGLYGDYTELDKNTPINKSDNYNKDVLTDRVGFYNREINRSSFKDANLNNDDSIIKNKLNYITNNVGSSNFKEIVSTLEKRITDLETKVKTLNENIIVLNKNLNIAKDKINENLIFKSNELLDISHFSSKKLKETNDFDNKMLNNDSMYDIINKARRKNDFNRKNNLSSDNHLEENIKNKVFNSTYKNENSNVFNSDDLDSYLGKFSDTNTKNRKERN